MKPRVTKASLVSVLVGVGLLATSVAAAADFTVATGNAGSSGSWANGGAVGTGDVNSGGTAGNSFDVGNTHGDVDVFGGRVSHDADARFNVNGGLGISAGVGGGFLLP